MKPTRAAWFFAAGLAWLVLRGIFVDSFPSLGAGRIAQEGGIWLAVPVLSFFASLAAPVFFIAFLRHHPFSGQKGLWSVTVFAVIASVLSCLLVLVSLITTAGVVDVEFGWMGAMIEWLPAVIPLGLVVSIFLFLSMLAGTGDVDREIRSAAGVGAIGTLIPCLLILAWIANSLFGLLPWYPAFSQSLAAKVLGLGAAAALFRFLESFATRYGSSGEAR